MIKVGMVWKILEGRNLQLTPGPSLREERGDSRTKTG
jgi:hypothetical protein